MLLILFAMTKKEKIEHVARDLFFRHGFRKVTVDEICRKAHVSRKTYYSFYDNKNALVVFILNALVNESVAQYEGIIQLEMPFADKLVAMLQLKYEFGKSISKEFIADFFDPGAAEILAFWQQSMVRSLAILKDFLEHGQKSGDINPELNINYILWYFQKMTEMMKSPELMNLFQDAAEVMKQVTQSMIYGLMPPPK
jgi:AcrR family transcriptional regulator